MEWGIFVYNHGIIMNAESSAIVDTMKEGATPTSDVLATAIALIFFAIPFLYMHDNREQAVATAYGSGGGGHEH